MGKIVNKIKEIPSKIKKIPGKIKELFKRLWKWIKLHIYGILYFILIVILSTYIVLNWDKCISMKFFEQFDGNNILFLVWIALLILFFYDVEAKDMKFKRKEIQDTEKQLAEADSDFQKKQLNNLLDNIQMQNSNESNERNNGNEKSN